MDITLLLIKIQKSGLYYIKAVNVHIQMSLVHIKCSPTPPTPPYIMMFIILAVQYRLMETGLTTIVKILVNDLASAFAQ